MLKSPKSIIFVFSKESLSKRGWMKFWVKSAIAVFGCLYMHPIIVFFCDFDRTSLNTDSSIPSLLIKFCWCVFFTVIWYFNFGGFFVLSLLSVITITLNLKSRSYKIISIKIISISYPPKTLKYWVDVQRGQSYLMGRRILFSLGWPPF